MPTLELWHWADWAPAIGNNRELPAEEQFIVQVKAGVPRADITRFMQASGRTKEDWVRELEHFLRIGPNASSIGGREMKGIVDLVDIALDQAGSELLKELIGAIAHFNSVKGARSFTWPPPSGTAGTTTAGGATETDSPASGSGTSG